VHPPCLDYLGPLSLAVHIPDFAFPFLGHFDGCAQYEYAPLVYLVTVPIWLGLLVLWGWNTYYKNALHARDLHRVMCWVPMMEFVHGLLSLFNYYSCPWESVLALIYATFWSILTILKEPVILLCLLLVAKGERTPRKPRMRRKIRAHCTPARLTPPHPQTKPTYRLVHHAAFFAPT
jgi:hypothetical protein